MKKRSNYLLFILTAILFAAALLFSAHAETPTEVATGSLGETVTYTIINEGSEEKPSYALLLSGTGSARGMDTEDNYLKYDTRKSSVLAPYAEHIVRAEVGEGITALGNYSLAFLPSLGSITIPSTLTEIGSAALQDCNSLTRMGYAGKDKGNVIDLSGIDSILSYAFTGCYSIKIVILSDQLSGALGTQTFYNCRSLTSLTIPAGVTAIGTECFGNCISMRYIELLSPAASVSSSATKGAEHIVFVCDPASDTYGNIRDSQNVWGGATVMDIPFAPSKDSVANGSVGSGIYWEIKEAAGHTADSPKYKLSLTGDGSTLALRDKWGKTIGFNSYRNGPFAEYLEFITDAEVLAPVSVMQGNIFTGMTKLERVQIPSALTRLEGAVFEHCGNLSSVYLEGTEPRSGVFDMSKVVSISAYCFDGCKKMTEIIFSENLENENIYTETFKNCDALKIFTVPAVIKRIDKDAFLDCEGLTEIIFEADTSIDPAAFTGCESLKYFRGFSNSAAEEYALASDIEFLYPCVVAIRRVGTKKLISEIEVVSGQGLYELTYDGMICLAYTDPEGKVPYVLGTAINSAETIYVEPLFSLDSLKARPGDTVGLRALFSLSEKEENGQYKIAEAGAIASRDRGSSDVAITLDMNYITKAVFFSEGNLISPLSSPVVNGKRLSFTAVGFTNENGGYDAERCAERLNFRGYAILEDKVSGEKHTVYTHMLSGSLYERAKDACQGRVGAYSAKDTELLSVIASMSECEKAPMTRAEILSIVEKLALGEIAPLKSENIEIENALSIENYISDKYNESGDLPAVLRFDASSVYDGGLKSDEVIRALSESFAEFSEIGGSVLIYLRPDNPMRAGSTGGEFSSSDWKDVFVSGTPQNNAYLSELGKTGRFLQHLKEAGVTLYVNLLPEISGSSWWCREAKELSHDEMVNRYISLYRYTVDYFRNDCALDNVVWIYEGGNDGEDFFPGNSHVDIYSGDFESSSGSTTLYQLKERSSQ